ncbi:monovalent cation/H+ antiporter complex subunit F [Occultella gossypii]|uniref:PH regulation protein F n=1 Tax=Occultella gossypii TaxID=2800820 RepID=A0ABS7SEK6_9MICO|nr:monovalent cation/H+ antiporter complex subunit F [Occultella gossypii]MBZ2198795.1 pH regulation protein F [Occultella gossypii]
MSVGVLITCGVLLTAAAILAMSRVERGPSMLDRIVAIDVMVAAIIGCLAILSAWSGRVDLVPVLMVLALVGFVGSVTLARFAAAEPDEERRILTPEEIAEADAKVRAELEEES